MWYEAMMAFPLMEEQQIYTLHRVDRSRRMQGLAISPASWACNPSNPVT